MADFINIGPLQRIVNVHWGGELAFLYSGSEGMFASNDGSSWEPAPSSVAAISLAWVDDVWVGCGPSGSWRSEDKAQSWVRVGTPEFFEVVAMKPPPDAHGNERKGIFAGFAIEGDDHLVYTSLDLGKNWSATLTIPTDFGSEGGSEAIRGLSGCGHGLFACTVYNESRFHHGDGKIYSSIDGMSFSAQTVFGPGNVTPPLADAQYPREGFAAFAVGYDEKTKTYAAIGARNFIPSFGLQESYLIYTTSSGVSFGGGKGTTIAAASQITGIGEFISPATSAAGGDGKHVAGAYRFMSGPGGSFISGALEGIFIPGATNQVASMGGKAGGYIGSFCFKSDSKKAEGEVSTDGSSDPGEKKIFACVAFDSAMNGGAFIANEGGEFALRKGGTGIDIGGKPRGAVAVGKVGFLNAGV